MAATATGSCRRTSGVPVIRSLTPSGRFHLLHSCSSSTAFVSSISTSRPPTCVNLYGNTQSVRPISTVNRPRSHQLARKPSKPNKRTCMCSPTTHPGSFRCSLHKNSGYSKNVISYSPNIRLDARKSAMTNSLVRIGGVEGDLVKRALSALIRPSSNHQRRRSAFEPRASRLSLMSKAEDF